MPAKNDIKLNIGCGPNRKPSWVNIDLLPDVDVSLDIREPMPFPDNSVTIVYSEHFFEHLDYPSPAKQLLNATTPWVPRVGWPVEPRRSPR